jgi:hypothetical protein
MTVVIDVPEGYGYRYGRGEHHGAPRGVTVEQESNQEFLASILGPVRVHYLSRDKLYVAHVDENSYGDTWNKAQYDVPLASLGVQAIHQCFSAHVPLELRPDTAWYMVVHQVAEHVKQNSAHYAHLFTSTPGEKQKIKVRDDSLRYDAPSDWGRAINLFRNPLVEAIGDRNVGLFLPRFSTTTAEDETSALVAFMDTVSPYYEYTVQSMCHIPQFRLEGTAADWLDLYNRTEALAGLFDQIGGYFADLLPVLREIAQTANGAKPDLAFWSSIYKENSSSGSDWVTGWINTFFAHTYGSDGATLKESFGWKGQLERDEGQMIETNMFPSHISTVPFVWEYFGRNIDMTFAAGVTGVDYDGTFLAPRLGFAVAER